MMTNGVGSEGKNLIAGLFDLRFTQIITTQMVPTIYTLSVVLAALATVNLIAWGFEQSWLSGAAWLLVLGPGAFLAMIVTIRVTLEFVLIVFRMAFYLEAVGGQVDTIAGQTDELLDDLPRIRFWKPRNKANS